MTVHVPTYEEQWREYVAISRRLSDTPACEHLAFRYEMRGCPWCEIHADLGRLERDMDRLCRTGRAS